MTLVEHYLLPATLFLLMFSMGLSLTLANFVDVFRYRTALVVGVASLALLVPAIGLALAHSFPLAPLLAVGVVLTAACPGGTFSNLLTHYARGDLALAISLTALTSLVAVITIPLYVHFALTEFLAQDTVISMPVGETILRIFGLTIVPVSLGVLVHARGPARISALADPLKNLAALLIGAFFLLLILGQHAAFIDAVRQVWAPILCLNATSMITGYALARLFRLPRTQRTALTIEHAIKQEGTGIYVAVTILGLPLVALPLLVNSVCGLTLGSLFTWAVRRRRVGDVGSIVSDSKRRAQLL